MYITQMHSSASGSWATTHSPDHKNTEVWMEAPGVPRKFSPYHFLPSENLSFMPTFWTVGSLNSVCGACDQLFNAYFCTLVVIILGFWCLYAQRGNGFWRLRPTGRLRSLFFFSTSLSNFWMRERRERCGLLQAGAIRCMFAKRLKRFWCFLFFHNWKTKLGFFIAPGVKRSRAAGVVFADASLSRGCSCLYPCTSYSILFSFEVPPRL